MNDNIYSRTIQLIGEDAIIKLKKTTVLIVGIGGVGGTCFETLVRSGVGTIIIIESPAKVYKLVGENENLYLKTMFTT